MPPLKPDVPILRTKLYRPSVAPDCVRRERLLARLEAGRGLPLTLVSAPAGYGKSTLVAQWQETTNTPSAWLTCDEADSHDRRSGEHATATRGTTLSL